MELGLKGRIALVTGASKGIGRAIAEEFAREGVNLALFSRDRAKCEALAGEIRAMNGSVRVVFSAIDFERPDTIRPAVAAAAEALGGVDILVNCAGGAPRGLLEDIPDEKWDEGFAVKPIGLMRMSREVLPYLRRSTQPRIINIAGTRGRQPSMFSVMAGPINFGTLSATKVLAHALGADGITVNAVNPGSTDTGRWTDLIGRAARERGLALRRLNRLRNAFSKKLDKLKAAAALHFAH